MNPDMPAPRHLRGFILPTSLLVLTLLTVMLTAAFVLVAAEFRSTDNAAAGTRALALAQAGLQSYFSSNHGLKATNSNDSVRYTFSTGYADVVARKMLGDTAGTTTWVVRSAATTTDPLLRGQVTARRTVAQMAFLNPSALPMRAAIIALNGVNLTGTGQNPISGNNTNTAACSNAPAGNAANIADLTTVPGGYTASNGQPATPEYLASVAAVYDSTHIDWAAVVSGSFNPDYVIPGGSLPAVGNNTWLVGYVTGDITIPASVNSARQGILLVTGNVTFADNAVWNGIILAGGFIQGASTTASWNIGGFAVSGLNCGIGGTCPAANQLDRGSRNFKWSWCYAHLAVDAIAAMSPRKNTVVDSWAGY